MSLHDAPVLHTLAERLQPAHTALVIVDMQNDFCAEEGYLARARAASGSPNRIDTEANRRIAACIDRVAAQARTAGMPVVWLQSVYDFKYLAPAHIAQRGGREGCCLEGSWGADYFEIRPQEGDAVVIKHTYSGFHGTGLDALLQARGVRSLLLCGVATNVCVESTLREGFFHGYHVALLEDGVGSGNPVGHAGTLATVRVNFGDVLDSTQFIDLLAAAP
jgi:nicotinamidase-related amidase